MGIKTYVRAGLIISIIMVIIGIILLVLWKTNVVSKNEDDKKIYSAPGIALTSFGLLFVIIMTYFVIISSDS